MCFVGVVVLYESPLAYQSNVEILPGRSTKDVRNPPSESSGCGHGSNTPIHGIFPGP